MFWDPSEARADSMHFSKADRLLVVAPHPDDEALGTGGLIQAAREAGAEVKIVYLTHGESNEIAWIFYQKKPLVVKSDFIRIGRIRKQEAIQAMSLLGLDQRDLFFFGYPDRGTMRIWQKYWDHSGPFRSFFTRINKVIHKEDFSYGHYYKGENIVHDFEKVLKATRPTHIFVTAPFDLNPDHQAAYLYLNVAVLNLSAAWNPPPKVYLYLVHAHGWPSPKEYLPAHPMPIPAHIRWGDEVRWESFQLRDDQQERKKETILKYKSQTAYSKNFLLSFSRSNEIFSDYQYQRLVRRPGRWPDGPLSQNAPANGDVSYQVGDKEFLVDIPLLNPFDEMGVLNVDVFGYRRSVPFSQMPKISLRFFGNRLFVSDGFKDVPTHEIYYKFEGKRVLIRLSLKLLKNPDFLFVSTRSAKDGLSLDFGAWRILEISGPEAGRGVLLMPGLSGLAQNSPEAMSKVQKS